MTVYKHETRKCQQCPKTFEIAPDSKSWFCSYKCESDAYEQKQSKPAPYWTRVRTIHQIVYHFNGSGDDPIYFFRPENEIKGTFIQFDSANEEATSEAFAKPLSSRYAIDAIIGGCDEVQVAELVSTFYKRIPDPDNCWYCHYCNKPVPNSNDGIACEHQQVSFCSHLCKQKWRDQH